MSLIFPSTLDVSSIFSYNTAERLCGCKLHLFFSFHQISSISPNFLRGIQGKIRGGLGQKRVKESGLGIWFLTGFGEVEKEIVANKTRTGHYLLPQILPNIVNVGPINTIHAMNP